MFSGGVGSWGAAKRVAEKYGTDDLTLLFADTMTEDADTYRFLREAAANVGGQLVEIRDGRTIWEVFEGHGKKGFLGNSRIAHCSIKLKQEMASRWLAEHRDHEQTVAYVGIDWTEIHRFEAIRKIRSADGWTYEAPLCEPPYLTKDDLHDWATHEGLRKQRLYELGMAHANCGGGCVRAGIGHFAHLLRVLPDVYAEWEGNEERLRAKIGNVAILTDRRGGKERHVHGKDRDRVQDPDGCRATCAP